MSWIATTALSCLASPARTELEALRPMSLPRGTLLFRPGDAAQGFLVVLEGRVEVFLTGPTGREILLYGVEPGESCVQTTLGLMGGEDYTGEAIAATDVSAVLIPRGLFLRLMEDSSGFRSFVFTAFAARMQSMMLLLERVAFQRVESRLASALLGMAEGNEVSATQAELATRIGSAREVVSRRLDQFAKRGWVQTDRGRVRLLDPGALRRVAAADSPD